MKKSVLTMPKIQEMVGEQLNAGNHNYLHAVEDYCIQNNYFFDSQAINDCFIAAGRHEAKA